MDYDEQLERAISETPTIEETGNRFEVPDPEVRVEGKATVYENFQETVDVLGRDENHVMKFLQNELGTSASIDERGRARFTGDFKQSRVADAIDEYTEGYVVCSECGLPDTRLVDQQGATVIRCDACGAVSATGT
jgi:translation initiation factor 2 subunit 2